MKKEVLSYASIAHLITAAVAGLLITGCAQSPNEAGSAQSSGSRPVQMKLASLWNSRAPIQGVSIVYLTDMVDRASGGNLKIKVFDPGKLVGSTEILDAVSDGKVEAGWSTAGFWMGKMPAAPLFSAVPFGPDPNEYVAWFFAGNGMSLFQEMYDRYGFNVKVLVGGISPPETSGWFAHEIVKVEDLKGLKMRFFGLGGTVMTKLGVAVNFLPPGEIFPALEKGVIDATEYSTPSVDEDIGLYKIAKYNYFPGWHQQASAFELLINKDVWNNLSSSQQAIIELASRATVVYSIADAEATQAEVMLRNERERGVKNMTWPPEILRVMEEKWNEVAAEKSAEDEFFKKVYDDFSKFRKEYAVWGSRAYLPRVLSSQ